MMKCNKWKQFPAVARDLLNQGQNEKITTRGAIEKNRQFGLKRMSEKAKDLKKI
jgi:hypothetical protein